MSFGVTSAPEHFQYHQVLSDLPGVLCLIGDIPEYRSSKEEHNERVQAVLKRIQSAGITLNQAKCEFGNNQISWSPD